MNLLRFILREDVVRLNLNTVLKSEGEELAMSWKARFGTGQLFSAGL
jgi:hypothetical protein